MFGYESPLTYPDRLDRLNMLPLSYRRDISDLCQLYKFIQDPCSLPDYLQTVYILEMTSDVLDNLNHQIFQYHDVKMSNLEKIILTGLYIIGTSFPRVLKMQAHYFVLRKA